MEERKEKFVQCNSKKLAEDVSNMPLYKEFFNEVQKLTSLPNVKLNNFKETLSREINENGLETELRNNVYHWLQDKKKEDAHGANEQSFLRKAQIQWDKRIHKSLQSMCTELGISLAKIRTGADKDDFILKWGELSTYDVDISQYRPVYAPKDFLDVLLSLRTHHKRKPGQPKWEFSHLPLKVKTLDHLRNIFSELSRGEPLLGVNPHVISSLNYPTLEIERLALGEKVILTNHAPVAQEYLKKGCPRCYRSKLWMMVLGSEVKEQQKQWFQELKHSVFHFDLMIDKLIIKDIHLTAANDDQYFVYEDVLFQIMLCFSRDSEVIEHLGPKTQMQVILKGKQSGIESSLIFPPSGVIPFHGFTMYAAPFCYLYDDPCELYFTFRAFYLRYWFRLHRVCSHPQGIVSLCLLYERLLQSHEPDLWTHLKNSNIHPIRLAFKWIMRGFSGHLPPEQLLYLWDLILAYDTVEIIPLLAVSILSLRKENLMQVTTFLNIEAVLADLSSIIVMPLIQCALLSDDHKEVLSTTVFGHANNIISNNESSNTSNED